MRQPRPWFKGHPLKLSALVVLFAVAACCFNESRPGGRPEGFTPGSIAILSGDYSAGDGFVNRKLRLTPRGRFSFEWAADDGGHHGDEGTARVVDGLLVLNVEKSKTNMGSSTNLHQNYCPVAWGGHLYLVPDD